MLDSSHVRPKLDAQRRSRLCRQAPGILAEGWGASEFYTAGQVRTALAQLDIDPKFAAIAFAAYLRPEDYLLICHDLPAEMAYDTARSLFEWARRESGSSPYAYEPISNEQAVRRLYRP